MNRGHFPEWFTRPLFIYTTEDHNKLIHCGRVDTFSARLAPTKIAVGSIND